jgi:outer membrane protein assembly factor BamB
MNISKHTLLVAAFAALTSPLLADWRQFRGNDANGIADGPSPPTTFSDTENMAWKVSLPGRGLSSPIVVGDKVFISASSGPRQDRLHVLCFSAKDGSELWHRQVWATGRTMCHPKSSVAAPTPCSDGKRVFAVYSSNDAVCYDLDGNLQWYRALAVDSPNASNSLGMSSSPVVVDDTLVVMVESDADSFTTGLAAEDGLTRWKIARPRKANWTSPGIMRGKNGAGDLVLVQSSAGVAAVEPKTGKVAWNYGDGASTIPSLVVSEDVAYVPSFGVTALRPSPTGSEVPEMVWRAENVKPGTGSPLIYKDSLFVVANGGILNRLDPKDGSKTWQTRLKGSFSGSAVAAGDHLYLFSEDGVGQVVAMKSDAGDLIHSHSLGETILCTPAISDGALYVRSDGHLWKIAAK